MAVEDYGRVADDGTVYVRTADGERAVGSYPGPPLPVPVGSPHCST